MKGGEKMTEIPREARQLEPKQKLVDEYHPAYPAIQPIERARKPARRLQYQEALLREIKDIVEQSGANKPHFPCG